MANIRRRSMALMEGHSSLAFRIIVSEEAEVARKLFANAAMPDSHPFTRSPRRRGGGQDFGFANPRQPRFASPVRVRPKSARGGTVFGANEAQVADDFVAAAMVRRMIDAVDHRHVGKIKRAHAL